MGRRKVAAGIVVFRVRDGALEVLLAHPGGPLFRHKDDGHWSIPKGEPEDGEDLLTAARRETREEVGVEVAGPLVPLGSITQRGGKVVHAWAAAGDLPDGAPVPSNTFEMEWPPGSGRVAEFPEVDRARFFRLEEARGKVKEAQWPLLERLRDGDAWRR
jgi:predicted NUDIX family NTP pyrophosphohydrolase